MRNRLLVVDGEPRSRRVLEVNLRGSGFDVQTAADTAQAWSILENAAPDLIVCDADNANVDAFALCTRLRGSAVASDVPFLLLSASRAREQKIRALEAGADDFLVKPAYLKEILTRVRALLQRRERDALTVENPARAGLLETSGDRSEGVRATPFSGDLADIGVVDLIQLVEHNGRSGIIQLRGPSGAPAFIYFRAGRVIDAEAGRLSGQDALARLFSWTDGTFEVEWKNIRRKDVVHRPPSELVLDGMQRLDAWNELRGELGNPHAVFEVDYRLLAERLAEIPDEVNSVLRLCDGVRTVLQVVEESSMSDTEALTALLRLREEGIVYDKATPPSATARSEGRGTSDAPVGDGRGPMAAAVPRPLPPSGGTSRPVETSAAARRDGPGDPSGVAPASPRRTAPGLGQHIPPTEHEVAELVPGGATGGGLEQSNVIPFPAPVASATPPSAPLGGRAGPTVVGFVPVTTGLEPDVTGSGETTSSEQGREDVHPLSLTLPLGRAQEAGALREQALREHGRLAAATSLAPAEEAAPGEPASTVDTHRGIGSSPPAVDHEASPAAGVPLEVIELRSGPLAPSGPVSAPDPSEGHSPSGRVRPPPADEAVVASAAPSGDARSGSGRGPMPSAGAMVPPPSDATAKVSFADPDISRRDALDELGLPGRGRGLRLIVGALVLGAAAAVGVNRFWGARAGHPEALAPVDVSGQAATPPPAASGEPTLGPTPATPPVVTAPAVPSTSPESHRASAGEPGAPSPSGHEQPVKADAPEPPPVPSPAATAIPVPGGPDPGAAPPPASPARAPGAPGEKPPPPGVRELSDCRTAFARNRLREALAACTAAAAANPRSALALTLLAHTELNRGRLARANELAEKAIAIDPDQADAYVIIGGVHQDSGQNREAKAAYRRYLELAPRGRYADELRSIVNGL